MSNPQATPSTPSADVNHALPADASSVEPLLGPMAVPTRLERLERHTQTPLMVLAVLFLVAYATPIIWTGAPVALRDACDAIIVGTWILFAIDYVARLALATDRANFVKHNLIELASIALPLLRPLRLMRLVTLMEVFDRGGSRTVRGRVLFYSIGATSLLVFVSSLAITDAERPTESAINGFGDGLWWAFTTMTTVGYGDMAPVSIEGRVIAAVLMVGGVSLLGIVTASLASWLVQRVAADNASQLAPLNQEIENLYTEIKAIREHLNPDAPE